MTRQELIEQIFTKKSFLCVGLDTDPKKIPDHIIDRYDPVFEFNKEIIDATAPYCVAYKPNLAFYESLGVPGLKSFRKTILYLKENYPQHFIIADAKRGDIGNTSAMYAKTFFSEFDIDSVTVAPYMGEDSVKPFLEYEGKWVILLALTSNAGSHDFQLMEDKNGERLFERVLRKSQEWGTPENMMYVVGATQGAMFKDIRKIVPNHFLLVPGVGAQGGSLQEVCKYGMNKDCGLLVNSSRGIIYAGKDEDFAELAGNKAREYIDILAFHNMNVFHWHLSDDQGWRIEMKRHPRLTEIGAWRSGTVLGHNSDLDDGIPHGGYYTQEQAREIVRYAQERHITVMPEIDLPGHTKAVLACYPELGCTGGPYEVGHRWGVYADVLCMGNPQCYDLVRDIIDELIDIFPSKYVHIGGDETPTVRWEACPKCNAIDRKGMTYQGYFTQQIVPYLEAKGRRAIGWDEILYTGADTNTAIMSWRGSEPGAEAAAKGHDVVMAPTSHCYFDYQQSKDVIHEPDNSDGGYIPVEKVYSLNPIPADVNGETRRHILGVQANAWAEHLRTPGMVEYMTLPRMAALSEVAWTLPEKKDYKDFVRRVTRLTEDYESYHWQYAKHLWPERRNNQALE